jgi:hypothetical protein
LGKSSYLVRLHFGRFFDKVGRIFTKKRPVALSVTDHDTACLTFSFIGNAKVPLDQCDQTRFWKSDKNVTKSQNILPTDKIL